MALGDMRIYTAKSVVFGEVTIKSATHWGLQDAAVESVDPGPAGTTGEQERLATHRAIRVTIFAMDAFELQSIVEDAAANLVLGYYGEAGVAKTLTIKNVMFNQPPSAAAPPKDSGIPPSVHSITGGANWADADTWLTMETWA